MLTIVEYVGPANSQGVQYGTPFLVIGFCGGEWELSRTTWFDVKEAQDKVRDLFNALAVNLSVSPENYEIYFRKNCEISK
jgi:hypothetical protein